MEGVVVDDVNHTGPVRWDGLLEWGFGSGFGGLDTGDVAGYPPTLGGVIAPGLDTCCAPFAETVEDRAILGFESVAHAIVALGGAAGGPIVARGR